MKGDDGPNKRQFLGIRSKSARERELQHTSTLELSLSNNNRYILDLSLHSLFSSSVKGGYITCGTSNHNLQLHIIQSADKVEFIIFVDTTWRHYFRNTHQLVKTKPSPSCPPVGPTSTLACHNGQQLSHPPGPNRNRDQVE